MQIGILGTGDVARAIGKGFVTLGHPVKLGSRDANNEKARAWAQEMGKPGLAGSFADAAAFGEVVVLATLGTASGEVLKAAGADNLRGKVLIDTTNPLGHEPGSPPKLAISGNDSGGEQVQRLLPGTHVVKAFNTVGNPLMFRPELPGGPPDMFICGNDEQAKQKVGSILKDFGWGVADIGDIQGSRYLEAMCMTWVLYGIKNGTWNHAFKLLKK